MKNVITVLFVLTLLACCFSNAQSQNMHINAYSFYTLDDDINANNGYDYLTGTIKGNLLWGGSLEYNPEYEYGLELLYLREDTDVPTDYSIGTKYNQTFKLGANYIMFGGTRYLRLQNKHIEPFAGMLLGVAILENKEPLVGAPSSATKFAWMLKAGVNIMATKQVGLKLQMQLLSAVQSVGGSLFLGTGGTSAGLGTFSTMLQFGIGGGLTFRLGK